MNRDQELAELREGLSKLQGVISDIKWLQIERLFELAATPEDSTESVLVRFEEFIQAVREETGTKTSSSTPPSPPPDQPVETAQNPNPEPAPPDDFTPIRIPEQMRLKDEARYMLLEAALVENEEEREHALDKALEKACSKLGIQGNENRYDQLRGIFARAKGKFRADFISRQLLQYPEGTKRDDALSRLSRLYGEDPVILLAEAQAHTAWKRAYSLL